MVLNPVEGAFTKQVVAQTEKLIDPGRFTHCSVMALMGYIESNEDKPETIEKHKEWLIVSVVVGVKLHPYHRNNKEKALQV